jgi:hypothetical protein
MKLVKQTKRKPKCLKLKYKKQTYMNRLVGLHYWVNPIIAPPL